MATTGDARRYPTNAWYVLATGDEVGDRPLGRRAADAPVVLYRTGNGTAVALEDRCAHRPYPLSLGRVEGDAIVSGYTGFAYGPDGACIRVPTQAQVPPGAHVRAFPVHDDGAFVWAWMGDAALAGLRRPPRTPWLRDEQWSTFGGTLDTAANVMLLHENFADITHVAVVDPYITPPVLRGTPPPLEIQVSETSVSFSRSYSPAPLAGWHAAALELPADAAHPQRETGGFVSPGLWVNTWEVHAEGVTPVPTFRFTHAITPVDSGRTTHVWRVSRNFSPDEATTATLRPIFAEYYDTMRGILEIMQSVLDRDGPRREVNVAADAAALQVRKIMAQMVAEENGTRSWRSRAGSRPGPTSPARRGVTPARPISG
ncbi:MAG: vanillate O-demethylase oxygenase [Pseudonocardia sp.]|jgi:vanillate O-demethylase monooxygenase subunit|nr:vanillate O-demethylase oxygenase [Pseudonocardia sp.]